MKKLSLALSVALLSLSVSAQAMGKKTQCSLVTRAAFDIGSTSTKMKVARVDTCTQKIEVPVLLDKSIKVDYKGAVAASPDKATFSESIQNEGLEALSKLKAEAIEKGATQFAGVATSGFRDAKTNGAQFAATIREKLEIAVVIIDANQEGLLGFAAGVSVSPYEAKNAVVWDIGGGSQQLTWIGKDGTYKVYQGNFASRAFQAYILKDLKGLDPTQSGISPNPIGALEINMAMGRAAELGGKDLIQQNLYSELMYKLNDPKTVVVGIGGVLGDTVQRQIKKDIPLYNENDLIIAIDSGVKKTDQELEADFGKGYIETLVSNLGLIRAFMGVFEFKEFYSTKANLTEGILAYPVYWQ